MSVAVRPLVLPLLIAILVAPPVPAQPGTQAGTAPTADDVKALKEKFAEEREQAVKAKFPTEMLGRADELVKRADAAAAGENFKAAVRHLRDARWQLPYLPPGLPEHVTRVLGESRMRHAARVNALAYSPDNATVASASSDFTVKVWDIGNGREIVTYRGHVDQPDDPTRNGPNSGTNPLGAADVAFHPKGKVIASASGNQVHTWDPATGKLIKVVVNLGKNDKPIKTVAFSPDGKQLAVGSDDGILRVVESDTGKEVFTSPPRNARIEKVAFSPNGKLIAAGDNNQQVAVYAPQAKGNTLVMSVQGIDLGAVAGVAFTADSGAVFACGRDGKVRLTAGPTPDGGSAPTTATKLREYVGHSGTVNSLAVTADGKFLVTGGEDKSVRVWDVASGKQLRSFQGHTDAVTAVAVRGDGRQVASASGDGAMRVWDLTTVDDHKALTDAKESLWALALSPDGKHLAAAGADKMIRVYAAETGKLEASLDAGAAITALAFLSDTRLAAGGGDKTVKIWDVAAKKVLKELPPNGLAVLAIAASADGKLLVTGSADATLRGFDPESGKELWKWAARKAVCGITVRKGGAHVAVGLADGTMAFLDVSGAMPKELSSQIAHTAGCACVAFSPAGHRLASVGGDGALRVWSVDTNGALAQLHRFEGQAAPTSSTGFSPLSAVCFSPDGRFVVTGGADTVVRIWDVQTKTEVRGLRGHTDWVTAVCFTPDGRYVASAAAEKDNTVRIFELSGLDPSSAAGGHMLAANAVAVSPNGKLVATAGRDQTIKVWDTASGKEIGTLVGNAEDPLALAFLSDDALVMGGRLPGRGTGQLHFWSTSPPRLNESVVTGEVFTIVPSADGKKIGVWAARPVVNDSLKNSAYEIYDAKGKVLSTYADNKGRNVRAATFTPDLAWVVAGDETGGVQIFDMVKNERIGGNMPLFERSVGDIGVTADKKTIVATDDEGLVKVTEVTDGKLNVVAKGKAHKSGVRALLVSPTNKTFFTISNDHELKVWSLTSLKADSLTELRSWTVPVTVNGAAYTPDGKSVVTANADGTAYVLELP